MIEKALAIKGFMSEPELQWLAQRARESEVIVEIGCFYGRSTRALADNTKGKVYCIDPWPGAVWNIYGNIAISSGEFVFKKFQENLKDHIESSKVIVHRGIITDFPVKISPDFIFIDGDHLFEGFKTDLEWAIKIVKKGIISGHDYDNRDWPAVKELVDTHFPIIGREGYIWWAQK